MTFADLDPKTTYDSDEDDLLSDFYIPVLSRATRYDRLAGYFSSGALAASARGMANFIQNNGKMRLVTSIQISAKDHDAIKKGLTNPDEIISDIFIRGLDLADQIQKNRVEALAWMIAQKNLEIKIAIPLDADNEFHTGNLSMSSIYHQKIGILEDETGNRISFSGSINETGQAWTGNIEEFKVFCSWRPGQDAYCASDTKKFEKFWHDRSSNTKVVNLPQAIHDKLVQIAPASESEAITKLSSSGMQNPLRDYQADAVKRWLENCRKGILEMATGTGKTRTAISCIRNTLDDPESRCGLVVIACPFTHLVTQWAETLESAWNIPAEVAYGSSKSWHRPLSNKMLHVNDGVLENLVIVTTHDTFSSTKFTDMVKSCRKGSLVVVDEVHKIGAEKRSDGLLEDYSLRLGLSATPERYIDDTGTRKILDYFDGVVYEFGLDKAIAGGYLTRYRFFPHVVYMTDDEADDYHKHTRQIAIESAKKHPDYDLLQTLSIKRSNICVAWHRRCCHISPVYL